VDDVPEPVEEEEDALRISVNGRGDFASLSAEALDEALSDEFSDETFSEENPLDEILPQAAGGVSGATANQGVEALQALLQALSNQEVAKSLKGMNISINISFGDKA